MTSLLSSDMENYEIVENYINEIEYFYTKIIPPDINRSFYTFSIVQKHKLRYGFGVIKGIGKSVISEIIYNRNSFGSFNSFFEFLYRINTSILSKRVLESLIYSGCFKKLNTLKFKLVLISAKVFDLYFTIKKIIMSEKNFLDCYFNYSLKNFSYTLNYKQNEIKETQKLLNQSQTKNILNCYAYESKLIGNLSFSNKNYFNEIYCGIIKNITIKKFNVSINIEGLYTKKTIIFSYNRYKLFEKILKKYHMIIVCYYKINNNYYELFVENFYMFRYKFIKKIEIFFFEKKISEKFLQYLLKSLISFVKGCTNITFKIPFKGKYKEIKLKKNIYIFFHDNNIHALLKFKEIKGLKLIYKF